MDYIIDDTIYDTVFQTTSGLALIIRVYLPINAATPSFTLHGVRATHEWLDVRMKVIGYSPIVNDQSWKNSNLKLGDAVYTVIHHFQLNPPNVMEITDVNLRRLQESITGEARGGYSQSAPPAYQGHNASNSTVREQERLAHSLGDAATSIKHSPCDVSDEEVNSLIPSVPNSFPALETMAMSELKQLLNDESSFESFIQQTLEVVTLNELKQSIVSANVDAARANLMYKERVDQQNAEMDSLRDGIQSKLERYNKLNEDRLALTRPPDLSGTLKDLNHAKKEAYHDSEAIADDWIESGGDVSDFVKKFMEVRELYHARAAKAERLSMSM